MKKRSQIQFLCLSTALFIISSCSDKSSENEVLFEKIDKDKSGITFVNTVPENDTLNQFTYHYLYNGTGVAVGDINNDGLPDMYFSGNEKSSCLYLNKGDFKFEDITKSSGTSTDRWVSGVTMVDVNNDGFLDIYACVSGPRKSASKMSNLLFINQKNNTFKEMASQWGVADQGNATCATFFDMDNDGDLDMYLGNHSEKFFSNISTKYSKELTLNDNNQQHLYRNDGNKFTDISESAGVKAMGYCLSATAGDFNEDGLTDLYICNDYHVPDFYLINQGNGKFEDKFNEYFKHSSTNSMGADQGDVNNDGYSDLITLDMLAESPRRYMQLMGPKDYDYTVMGIKNGFKHQYMKNALQINLGNGHFSDMSYLYGVAKSDWSWCPLLNDFNDDGFLDLFVSNGYYREVTDLDFMLYQLNKEQSKQTQFTHEELLKNIPSEKLQNFLFMNEGGNGFVNKAAELGLEDLSHSTGGGLADFNNDGRIDLIVCNQGEEPFLYKNTGNSGNYLNVKAEGNSNKFGVGCKIFVEDSIAESGKPTYRKFVLQPSRGYQSSSQPIVHIGFGEKEKASSMIIVWPGGKFQRLENVDLNKTLIVKESDASGNFKFDSPVENLFVDNTDEIGLDFLHQEQENPDFKREPLLPHRYTTLGPGMSSADVNGDGLMDLFITNARESNGCKLYLQNSNGKFSPANSQPWKLMSYVDVIGCLFVDTDNDGDQDLYLAAGGSEYDWPSDKYNHEIFLNDGKGNFKRGSGILPNVNTSGGAICAADYDADGDVDLFVGGRILPGNYPKLGIRSYLLQNNGGKFRDVTEALAPDLVNAGMITSAVFADFSGDHLPDLVLCGEWMPVIFMENNNGKLVNKTAEYGDVSMSGWMNSILPIDIDNDGDLDFVIGNKGNNSFIQARTSNPLKVYWADFDRNGRTDIAMSYTYSGVEYPLFTMDEMGRAYPVFIRKKFTRYKDIAGKSIVEIFGQETLQQNSLIATSFSSVIAVNNGGKFQFNPLPLYAQAGPLYGTAFLDLDNDGFDDIIGFGNNYNTRVPHGRDDAMSGFVLANNNGNLEFKAGSKINMYNQLDAKSVITIPIGNTKTPAFKATVIVSNCNGQSKSFNLNRATDFIAAPRNSSYAIVKLKNGQSKIVNLNPGKGYLSSDAPGVWTNNQTGRVDFFNSKGQKL